MYIAVAGNISAGKTSLTRMLSQRLGFKALYESARENPYLSDFYRDMGTYSFRSQIFFLSRKLAQREALLTGQDIIQDRTVYEDGIFARALFGAGFMSPRDYQTYREVFESVIQLLPHPDRLVYIKVSVSTILRRIEVRNELGEEQVPLEYLSRLYSLYEEWISGYNLSPVTTTYGDDLDWGSDSQLLESIIDRLKL